MFHNINLPPILEILNIISLAIFGKELQNTILFSSQKNKKVFLNSIFPFTKLI